MSQDIVCLINQAACGRVAGIAVCPKCGIDGSVMYPGEHDRQAAQSAAIRRYRLAEQQEQADIDLQKAKRRERRSRQKAEQDQAALKASTERLEREEIARRNAEEARRQAARDRKERSAIKEYEQLAENQTNDLFVRYQEYESDLMFSLRWRLPVVLFLVGLFLFFLLRGGFSEDYLVATLSVLCFLIIPPLVSFARLVRAESPHELYVALSKKSQKSELNASEQQYLDGYRTVHSGTGRSATEGFE